MPMPGNCLLDLLEPGSAPFWERPALLGENQVSLSHRELRQAVLEHVERLNLLGIGRGMVLAIALPEGPELALCLLAAACAAVAAPLDLDAREADFEFAFTHLNPRALVLPAGFEGPARDAARRSGLPVFELVTGSNGSPALYDLRGSPLQQTIKAGPGGEDQLALILQTAGTTARPKLVPLLQRNLVASARNTARSLRLGPQDRCLNVMPLHQIHGLAAGLLSALEAGGSAACPPVFESERFFPWLEQFRPTWYSAMPAIHQAILSCAVGQEERIASCPLRFIRSASDPLPAETMAEMERVFSAPVIEAYGMTEAAHQITSNPLPPGARKPGTVGLPAGVEVAIMAEEGSELFPAEKAGEVVIRGPNVMEGYLNNPEANRKAFTGNWFRTGDRGRKDGQGYLTILGRLKEFILRGGEKIAPREIDEVLLSHPDICQALAFGLPDPLLGEQVAAAVVLCKGADPVSEEDLRRYTAVHLVDYKVPIRIAVVNDLPRGPAGVLQRIGMAQRLGVGLPVPPRLEETPFAAPATEVEQILLGAWSEILGRSDFGVQHSFLSLGADPALAARLAQHYRQTFGVPFTLTDFFNFPTVSGHAYLIEERLGDQVGG